MPSNDAMCPPLRTPSLVLRHFVPEDAPLLMRLNGEDDDPPVASFSACTQTFGMQWLHLAISSSATRPQAMPRLGPTCWESSIAATAQLLGHVGFSPLAGEVEVSYAIAEWARGRGYATEALAQACAWAAKAFALRRLVAVTASSNLPSRRTLDRACFLHSGDEITCLQGSEENVSRYVWFPGTASAPEAWSPSLRPTNCSGLRPLPAPGMN